MVDGMVFIIFIEGHFQRIAHCTQNQQIHLYNCAFSTYNHDIFVLFYDLFMQVWYLGALYYSHLQKDMKIYYKKLINLKTNIRPQFQFS